MQRELQTTTQNKTHADISDIYTAQEVVEMVRVEEVSGLCTTNSEYRMNISSIGRSIIAYTE